MSFGKIALKAAVAASIVAVPTMVQASSAAQALSVSQVRAAASLEDESNLGGGIIIPLLALVAVALGVYVAVDDEDSDSA